MSRRNNNRLPNNLPQLQNLIKRDPVSYEEEFLQQFRHYESCMKLFQMRPGKYNESLDRLIMFLAHISHLYPQKAGHFPNDLMKILQASSTILDPAMRMAFCRGLILLRQRGQVVPIALLELFFDLFKCQDKILRDALYKYIVEDIKSVNKKSRNHKLNSTLQTYMYTMLKSSHRIAVRMSLAVMVELYRRNVWRDTKTVNVIGTGCFSKETKIMVASLSFFLSSDEPSKAEENADSDDDDDDDNPKKQAGEVLLAYRVGRKSLRRQKKMQRAMKIVKKKKRANEAINNFSAIHLLHDPQDFTERLYKQLSSSNERFEVRLMMMNLISRMIGIHELIVGNFYPFLQRYLQPHQTDVTRILMFAASACHELVPPECVTPVIKTITNNFVTERNSSEVMAVGLNAVREICQRCPLAMDEDLLGDLILYKSHKMKSVNMAAKSLVVLFREKNPRMLAKKERGRPTQASLESRSADFGENAAKDFIPGAEALSVEVDEEEQAAWESCSEDEESDGSWIDIDHSDNENVEEDLCDMTAEEKDERARQVVSSRILTQEDFRKIQNRQLAKQMGTEKSGRKRKAVHMEEETNDEAVTLDNIEKIYKRRKHDKESRLATILESKDDTRSHAHRIQRSNPHASTSNTEKKKKKNFMMLKHKIRKVRQQRSFRDRQMSLKKSLLKKLKNQR